MRGYNFKAKDLLDSKNFNLDLSIDPKSNWAINNIEKFPIEINRAPYSELMKVPGFGRTYANRIIEARKFHKLTYDSLKAMKISTKRAKHFILVNGIYKGFKFNDPNDLRTLISTSDNINYEQLSMFDRS